MGTEEGEALGKKWGYPFYETSAKEGVNVEEAFFDLVRKMTKKEIEREEERRMWKEREKRAGGGRCCVM